MYTSYFGSKYVSPRVMALISTLAFSCVAVIDPMLYSAGFLWTASTIYMSILIGIPSYIGCIAGIQINRLQRKKLNLHTKYYNSKIPKSTYLRQHQLELRVLPVNVVDLSCLFVVRKRAYVELSAHFTLGKAQKKVLNGGGA